MALRTSRYQSSGEQIIIADAAWNELVTNDRWPSTLRASFHHLSALPNAVVASRSVSSMQKAEWESGQPMHDIVHEPMTVFLREVVAELANGEADAMRRLRNALRVHGLNDKSTMGARRKQAMEGLVATGLHDIPPDRFGAVRNSLRAGERGPFLELVAEGYRPNLVCDALIRQGVRRSLAERLVSQASVTVMLNLFFTHMALEWTVAGGINAAKESRVHNDFVDVEYSVIAWACGGEYVSHDRRALRRHDEVMALCDRFWP